MNKQHTKYLIANKMVSQCSDVCALCSEGTQFGCSQELDIQTETVFLIFFISSMQQTE